MSRILITGGAGFIGSNLAERLLREGYEVMILDTEPNPRNIGLIRDEIEYHRMDICDPLKVRSLVRGGGIQGIVHLAAVSRVIWGQERPQETIRTNVGGTDNLLRALRGHRLPGEGPWVIFGSSREVYGEPTVFPVSEDHPVSPVNLYGRTKLQGENLVREFTRATGSRAVILRFSNVYGNERDILDRVIPRFVLSALKGRPLEIHGGNQMIDFTHIKDTVEGIVRTIRRLGGEECFPEGNGNSGETCADIHLLPGRPCTLQQAAASIMDHLGTDLPVRYADPRNYDVERFHGDPGKAEQLLGFRATIPPERGIPMTVDRFRMVMNG